jgi:urea transport system substrate-binding protein
MSYRKPENKKFIADWKAYVKAKSLPGRRQARHQRPDGSHYVGIKMWAQAVEQAGTTDVNAVRQAVGGQVVKAPSGFDITMDGKNHHLHKPVYIAEVRRTASSRSCGRRTARSAPCRGAPSCPRAQEGRRLDVPWVCGNCTEPKFKGSDSEAVSARP